MVNPSKAVPPQGQLSFDWSAPAPEARNVPESDESVPEVAENASHVSLPASSDLVQILPWDFRTSFPEPLEDAIDAGRLQPEDATPENIKALHEEHAQHALVLLSDLDAISDARRRGVDPLTGKAPRTPKQREALELLFRDEPPRLQHAFHVLMDVYQEVFGPEATDAFRKAIRASNAGIEVISDEPPLVPPLQVSVRTGIFGIKENGDPVDPGPEEVQAITESVADQLIENTDDAARNSLLRKYAEDFGQIAADQLGRWADRKINAEVGRNFDYDPGHPWHYYPEGDGNEPMPVEEIPPAPAAGESFRATLPKNPVKRARMLRQLLSDQETQLAQDKQRYTELVERGANALSDYDRNIAHGGNDELAWASALALKYNHVRNGLGRIGWLRNQQPGN